LEEKLDGLFTLLKGGAQPTPHASPSENTDAFPELPEIIEDHGGTLVNPKASFFPPPKRRNVPSHSAGYPTPSDSSSSDYYPSLAEAEELLHFFRTQMLSGFPFMVMPIYANSYQFQREHPFLWLCIMAVTSRSTEQQAALGKVRFLSLMLSPSLTHIYTNTHSLILSLMLSLILSFPTPCLNIC
jgi:hypothetical protein